MTRKACLVYRTRSQNTKLTKRNEKIQKQLTPRNRDKIVMSVKAVGSWK